MFLTSYRNVVYVQQLYSVSEEKGSAAPVTDKFIIKTCKLFGGFIAFKIRTTVFGSRKRHIRLRKNSAINKTIWSVWLKSYCTRNVDISKKLGNYICALWQTIHERFLSRQKLKREAATKLWRFKRKTVALFSSSVFIPKFSCGLLGNLRKRYKHGESFVWPPTISNLISSVAE